MKTGENKDGDKEHVMEETLHKTYTDGKVHFRQGGIDTDTLSWRGRQARCNLHGGHI